MESEKINLHPRIEMEKQDAIIVVDIQMDFMPTGTLGVKGADDLIEPINRSIEKFHHSRLLY